MQRSSWIPTNPKSTAYSRFELVYGWPPIHPIDIALNFDGFEEVTNVTEYARTAREWLEVARKIAREKVNQTHDTQAPRLNAKRSTSSVFKPNDLVLEWRPISGGGLTTKPLRKWIGPLKVVEQTSSVNYRVQSLQGKWKPYIVHVERLKGFNERTKLQSFELPNSKIPLTENQEVESGNLVSTFTRFSTSSKAADSAQSEILNTKSV